MKKRRRIRKMDQTMMQQPRILVIDDEDIILRSMKSILKLEGYATDTASSAADGLNMVQKYSYEIIFLDLKLPDTNGIKVLKDIKKMDAEAAVIIITGYATIKSAIDAIKLHAYDYILKPLEPDQIRNSLKTARKKKKYESELKKRIQEPRVLLIGSGSTLMVGIAQKFVKERIPEFSVRGAREAILYLKKDPAINTVLYDLECEKGEGMNLLESIKRVNPEIIFIPITSRPDLQDIIQMLKQGAYDYLTKPVKEDELFHLLKQAWNSTNVTFFNRQLMQDLQRSNEELDKMRYYVVSMMKILDAGVVVTDSAHGIILVNDICCSMLGYRDTELKGKPVAMLFDEEHESEESRISRLLKKEENRRARKVFITKSGKKIPALISSSTIVNEHGEICGAVFTSTELRTPENQLPERGS
jgi:PAS domain S-box-containing protein